MKKQKGKFILFDLPEFALWLNSTTVGRAITRIQNHHTWSPSYANFKGKNHFALLEGMETSHLERGFDEIGQNLTTFPDGTLAVCRSFATAPAGIRGANTGAICIENLGNFDQGEDALTEPHRAAIVRTNALLCRKYELRPDSQTIVYHHWYDLGTGERKNGSGTTKSCPGTAFFGGNTVAHADANFYNLISTEIQVLDTGPPANVLFIANVMAEALNVRATPGASGKKLQVLTKGVVLNVYEMKDGWCRIDPDSSEWVSRRWIERLPD